MSKRKKSEPAQNDVGGREFVLNELGLQQLDPDQQLSIEKLAMVTGKSPRRHPTLLGGPGLRPSEVQALEATVEKADPIGRLEDDELQKWKVVVRLLEDEKYRPTADDRRSGSWWILAELLAQMPFCLREAAMLRFSNGFRVFGKVPVQVRSSEISTGIPVVVGPPRPMACPEKAPEGSEWVLAWREGECWNWDLRNFEYPWDWGVPTWLYPIVKKETRKYFKLIEKYRSLGNSAEADTAKGLIGMMERKSESGLSIGPSDFELGMFVGVQFARTVLYRAVDELYAEKFESKKSAWRDILRHALDRHGWDTSSKKLLTLLEGKSVQLDRAIMTGAQQLKFPGWDYTPHKPPLTLISFRKLVSELRSEHLKRHSADSAHLAEMKRMLALKRRVFCE